MEIFDAFKQRKVTFIDLKQNVDGMKGGQRYEAMAIWKWRRGFEQDTAQQQALGDATVYIKPDEAFAVNLKHEMIGNLIELDGVLYRIFSQSEGYDFDTGEVSHYRLQVNKHERTDEWEVGYILT